MKPLEIIPTGVEGYVTLIFPSVTLTVPSNLQNDVKLAMTGKNPGLKELAEELIEESNKEVSPDPELVMHLVYAFMALKLKLYPPPVQLELFDEKDIENLPPEMKELNSALGMLKENTEEANRMILDTLIESPEIYKKLKEERLQRMATQKRMSPFRTFVWTVLVAGIGIYLLTNWETAHWGLVTAEALLILLYKQILFDAPQGENPNVGN